MVLAATCWTGVCFSFYLLNFFVKFMPGDIFVNNIMSDLSCIGGFLVCIFAHRFRTKDILVVLYTISAFIFLVMWKGNIKSNSVIAFLYFCGTMALNSLFNVVFYMNLELFPTKVVGSSFAICNLACRGLSSVAPLLAESKDKNLP